MKTLQNRLNADGRMSIQAPSQFLLSVGMSTPSDQMPRLGDKNVCVDQSGGRTIRMDLVTTRC